MKKNKIKTLKYSGEPFDKNNSENPWLLNNNKKELISDPLTGEKLTASYIWSQTGQDRKDLVERVFSYYRTNFSFDMLVNPGLCKGKIKLEIEKLKKLSQDKCINENGEIKNSNSTCTNVLKQFCGPLFYSSKGSTKSSKSCREVYESDDGLRKVLKNRMGWKRTSEDGSNRPYVFAISNKMIIQGMRSSGLGYTVSTFKPAIAKYIYSEFKPTENSLVFDFSAGWGARAIGASALGLEYWGIDPLTHSGVNDLLKATGGKGKVINGVSEYPKTYEAIVNANLQNKFTLAFSSPPYFNLEVYSNDKTQSSNKYITYEDWLEKYWLKTVSNIQKYILKKGHSKLILAMITKVKKHNIANDMVKICEESGLKFNKLIPFKTSRSHLSSKRKTGIVQKTTEGIYVFDW